MNTATREPGTTRLTDVMDVQESARSLGISVQTLRGAIYSGRIPAIERWGKTLIMRTDVEAYRARTQPLGVPRKGRPRKRGA